MSEKKKITALAALTHIPTFEISRDLAPAIIKRIEREEGDRLYCRLLYTTFSFSFAALTLTTWRFYAITAHKEVFAPLFRTAFTELQNAGFSSLNPMFIKDMIALVHTFIPAVEASLFVFSAVMWIVLGWKIFQRYRIQSPRVWRLRIPFVAD